MIDFRRYRGMLGPAIGLLAAAAVWNLALLYSFGTEPAWFGDPELELPWNQLEQMGAQVSGLELNLRRRGPDRQRPFGLVIGQSTALHSTDPLILQRDARPKMSWLVLNGFGSSFVKLNYFAQPLLNSRIKPTTIVLGLNPSMLVGYQQNNQPNADHDDPEIDPPKPTGKADGMSGWLWVSNQRKNISYYTNMYLYEARLWGFIQMDRGMTGLFPPSDHPWKTPRWRVLPTRRTDFFLKRQKTMWVRLGWFQPQTYQTTGPQADAFRALFEGCYALHPNQIVIVLLPVTSDLRRWMPPEAQTTMWELIDEVSAGRSVHVLDMQDALPDSDFADYAHMNPAGREVFTAMLAERLDALNTGN